MFTYNLLCCPHELYLTHNTIIMYWSAAESLETDYDSRDVEMVRNNDKFLDCFLSSCTDLNEVTQDMDVTLKLRKDYTLNGNYRQPLVNKEIIITNDNYYRLYIGIQYGSSLCVFIIEHLSVAYCMSER